jgi:epoxyqueuosine reductase
MTERVPRARVLDAGGRELSSCSLERAQDLLASGRAHLVVAQPMAIQLSYEAERPEPRRSPAVIPAITPGTPLLLHICCGPCATYPVPRLRAEGFAVVGWWYNPNVEPAEEHALRLASTRAYAERVDLALGVREGEAERYEQAVAGHSERPERCRICYRLRLEETAREAVRQGIEMFSTTLLISPYQDQRALCEIGEETAQRHGRRFYFENLRQGWAERGRLARDYGLYLQQYCGCRFSLAEREAKARVNPQ